MNRYSTSIRWMAQVREICALLDEYTYIEVKNELKARTRPRMVKGSIKGRENVGCFLPTDRQLQAFLTRVEWCIEIVEPRKHVPAKYRYVSALSTIPEESRAA